MKKHCYPYEFLKLYIEGGIEKTDKQEMYQNIQDNVIEYVRRGMLKEAHYLVKFDFDNGISDFNRLYPACLSPTDPFPEKIVKISITKSSFLHRGLSPLHCACINPNPNIIKTLIRQSPTFSFPDKTRRNLIHYAAANPNPDILKFLIANGSDPNELDFSRKTPLMIASELGRLGNVEVLLEEFEKRKKSSESGSENEENSEGGDEYDEEEEEDNEGKTEKIVVDYINCKDRSSWTSLMNAAKNGHLKVVEALIDAGATIEMKNSK